MGAAINDGYDLERIRVRMRNGNPFTAAELVSLTAGNPDSLLMVNAAIKRFHDHGYIVSRQNGDAVTEWTPTAHGLSSFAPPYLVPGRNAA